MPTLMKIKVAVVKDEAIVMSEADVAAETVAVKNVALKTAKKADLKKNVLTTVVVDN